MGTVYITQQPVPNKKTGWMPDFSSASEYGRIEFIFDGREKVYALPGPSLFKARKRMRSFNPDEDYILWPGVGDPASVFATIIGLMETIPSSITFLYWDRKRDSSGNRNKSDGFYVPCKFTLRETEDE